MDSLRNNWDQRYLSIVDVVSGFSKDPSTRVGALLIDPHNRPVSFGYNGLARGLSDTDERLLDREAKLRLTIHAEQNAILNSGRDLHGCKMYCTHLPCSHCMSSIVQAGISHVVCWEPSEDFLSRWSIEEPLQVAKECNINVTIVKR